MSADRVALSAHVLLADGLAWPATLAAAKRMLARDFGIRHVTLQPTWPLPPPNGRVIPVAAADDPHRKADRRRRLRPPPPLH